MSKIVEGNVKFNSWNLITGKFYIGDKEVYTGNLVKFLILRNSEYAKVKIIEGSNIIFEILEAK